MLCCLLCLTVCVVPALAANDEYTDGFIYPKPGLSIYYRTEGYRIDILGGYFPASFGSEAISTINLYTRSMCVRGDVLPYPADRYNYSLTTESPFYIEILYSVPAPVSFDLINNPSGTDGTIVGQIGLGTAQTLLGFNGLATASGISFVTDGELHDLVNSSNQYFTPAFGSYKIKHYYGYRFYFKRLNQTKTATEPMVLKLAYVENNITYNFSEPNYVESINENVTVNTGILQEINGKLTEIQTSTTQIKNDVSEIKNGLQDSNSSIWGAFKDSVSGLFVPSSAELEGVKNGFDQLAQDKLGGAYQTVDLVNNGVQSVVDKFKNPGSSPGVEFPGISVPLGGDVGTVTLAASQTVTIPEQITNVLYPVAGVIIPIVCVIWTIRQCTDMVECFMSGMSYAEFLHRNSDEEDNEV